MKKTVSVHLHAFTHYSYYQRDLVSPGSAVMYLIFQT